VNRKMGEPIDVGDEVFMPGRFIDCDGGETNIPSLRFGNISVMAGPIEQPNGYRGQSTVLDLRSGAGYSGSPVFVYRTCGSHFGETSDGDASQAEMWTGHTMYFLGLCWGQFPMPWEPKERSAAPTHNQATPSLITKGRYVEGLSGMTCVIPADD